MGSMLDITSETIFGIQQFNFGRHTGSATNYRSKLRISGTDYNGASTALAAAYTYLLEQWDTNPDAGAWTESVINGIE